MTQQGLRPEAEASPLRLLRERLGLSLPEFAAFLGVGYMRAYAAERGMVVRIPAAMLEALADAGADVGALERDHRRWIEERARSLREKVAGAVA
jgi:transcriptional regulator with XRE-family HTH domain